MKISVLSTIILLTSCMAFAQTPQQIEANLLKSFKRIDYWYKKANDGKSDGLAANDSLAVANDVFAKKLKTIADKYPVSITWALASLKKADLTILTSDDNALRIYSWDTQTGGTEHFFENVFQYKSANKTVSIVNKPDGDGDANAGPWYKRLYTLKSPKGTYYLATFLFIGSTKDISEGVQVFSISNGNLNRDTKIIKTRSGLHSRLSYDYDFRSIVNIRYEKRPAVTFDNQTQTIHLPLVNGKGAITKNEILYKFNGQYFEKVKN